MKTNAAASVMEARLYKRAVRVLAAENCRRPVVKRVLGNPGETGTFRLYSRGWFGKLTDTGWTVDIDADYAASP